MRRDRARWGACAATLALMSTIPAAAEPLEDDRGRRVIDVGAFVGGNYISDDIELGNSFVDDQVPGSAFLFGFRAGFLVFPDLAPSSRLRPRLGVEAELKIAASSTDGNTMRESHRAPVLGWRTHAIFAISATEKLSPFLVLGFGGETVFSDSPWMRNPDTDASIHYGLGLAYAIRDDVGMRADFRHILTAGRFDPIASEVELHVGAYYAFAIRRKTKVAESIEVAEPEPSPEPAEPADSDGDGVPDDTDLCPTQKEIYNQIDDEDGCPEIDSDNDGLLGSHDNCPEAAEDVDGFQDDNGCPDPDNDDDGRPDVVDQCPDDPETMNGFEDDDGCPDEIPEKVKRFTGVIKGIKFASGRAKITRRSARILLQAVEVMNENPSLRLRVEGHTDNVGPHEYNVDLSRKRADAVRWFMVDKGIDESRIETVGVGPDKPIGDNSTRAGRAQNRRIEFHLIHGEAKIPDPRTQPASGEDDGAKGEDEGESAGEDEGESAGEGEGESAGEDEGESDNEPAENGD